MMPQIAEEDPPSQRPCLLWRAAVVCSVVAVISGVAWSHAAGAGESSISLESKLTSVGKSVRHGPAVGSSRGGDRGGGGKAAAAAAPAGGRGREKSDEEVARRLKEDSERQDEEARRLRIEANKDYDKSQELSRKVGIIQDQVSRLDTKEAGYAEVIKSDEHSIAADRDLISKAVQLQAELGKRREEERKEAAALAKAKATAALDMKRKRRDAQHAQQQESRAQRLLTDANRDANEAMSSLGEAHKLKLSSESEVETAGGSPQAADDFQEAKRKEGESRKATSAALNQRSKSRLAEELVTVLRGMVSKDVGRLAKDKGVLRRAKSREERAMSRLEADERQEVRHPLSALRVRLAQDKSAKEREEKLLKAADAKGAKLSHQAQKDQEMSMRLQHAQHRLQLEGAKHLSQSTIDIQKEESTV